MKIYHLVASLQDEVGKREVRDVRSMAISYVRGGLRGAFQGARVTVEGGWF